MTNKFTPGPWTRANKRLVVQKSTGDLIAGVQGKESLEEMDANSRLISSAPELLSALQDLLAVSDAMLMSSYSRARVEAAKMAIAKARGES